MTLTMMYYFPHIQKHLSYPLSFIFDMCISNIIFMFMNYGISVHKIQISCSRSTAGRQLKQESETGLTLKPKTYPSLMESLVMKIVVFVFCLFQMLQIKSSLSCLSLWGSMILFAHHISPFTSLEEIIDLFLLSVEQVV